MCANLLNIEMCSMQMCKLARCERLPGMGVASLPDVANLSKRAFVASRGFRVCPWPWRVIRDATAGWTYARFVQIPTQLLADVGILWEVRTGQRQRLRHEMTA